MVCSNCGVCCTETEMLLCQKDIKRLEKIGFSQNSFVSYDRRGYAQLKNRDGYCVFYDLKNRRCSVYENRPSGCRVYPVILDEEQGIVVDGICQCGNTIGEHEKALKGKKVVRLLEIIDCEALERRSWSYFFLIFLSLQLQHNISLFFASASLFATRLVLTSLPQLSQMNCTSETRWFDCTTLIGKIIFLLLQLSPLPASTPRILWWCGWFLWRVC